ncbi:MAG: protein Asterix, partial [Planctomycetes bacterium]|nr:protein Asterix [Planctomycetota bacterium]
KVWNIDSGGPDTLETALRLFVLDLPLLFGGFLGMIISFYAIRLKVKFFGWLSLVMCCMSFIFTIVDIVRAMQSH